MAEREKTSSDESFPESIKRFASDIAILVREDLQSAREEMVAKAKTAGVGAGMLSGSALTGVLMLGSLTALAIIGLSAVVSAWLAALIVTLFWGVVTAVLALVGKRKIEDAGPPIPERTIENVKQDLEAARNEIR